MEMVGLSNRASAWIKNSIGVGVEIHFAKRLYGGISAEIYLVVMTFGGETKEVVFKQYTNESWLLEEPNLAANEMENLEFIRNENGSTPVPIAADLDGCKTGHPSVLMEKLDGAVVLEPKNFESWTSGLANTLASIHAIDAAEFPRTYSPYTSVEEIIIPTWGSLVEEWKKP